MRYSRLLGKTLRQASKPAEGTGLGHLLRAGMIRSSAWGAHTLLPLGARVMGNLQALAADGFALAGAQAIAVAPCAPTFKEQPAFADLKRELAASRRAARSDYFLAASHEETLAALAGGLNVSYRELPMVLAQQQWKYGDGGRWFLLQEAYAMRAAEEAGSIEDICRAVFADAGMAAFSCNCGNGIEYGVLSGSGTQKFAVCDSCDYRAAWDLAESPAPEFLQSEEPRDREEIYGPGMISVSEIAGFAHLPHEKVTKALLFAADSRKVAVCVRGDCDVSEAKLKRLLRCSSLEFAAPTVVTELTGAEVGYAGPIGLRGDVEVIWDVATRGRVNFEAGANKTDHHLLNLNFGRDLPLPGRFVDVRQIREGERCARCTSGRVQARRGDRIGHVTSTGEMYSNALGAAYAAREGGNRPLAIDCCGIDLSRLLIATAEQNADERGLRWPARLAPFAIHLVSVGAAEERAAEVYERLRHAGIEALWDDRQAPAGAKFSDADLIGIPVRLVVSPKTGEHVEWKERGSATASLKSFDEAVADARLIRQARLES